MGTSSASAAVTVRPATGRDAGELLTVQRAAFVGEAQRYREPAIPPLLETLDQLRAAIADRGVDVLVAETSDAGHGRAGRIVGGARLLRRESPAQVSRVVVAPDLQGHGVGSALLRELHRQADASGIGVLELVTGGSSPENVRLYQRHGYRVVGERTESTGITLAVLRREPAADHPAPNGSRR